MSCAVAAPGKLMLTGEYAVLEGAPAVVLAVDRLARVDFHEEEGEEGILRVDAPALGVSGARLALRDGRASLVGGAGGWHRALSVVRAVAERAAARGARPRGRARIDTGAFHHGERKLGLGSSAAVAVALYHALLFAEGRAPRLETAFADLLVAHRQAQGDLGSGADVAASVVGGFQSYRRDALPELLPPAPTLSLCAVDSGRPASTPELVRRIRAFAERSARAYAAAVEGLAATAERASAALRAGKLGSFLEASAAYRDGVASLGEAAGVDLFTGVHRRLARLAEHEGAIYKPSGAGGGDLGIALALDRGALEAFAERATSEGFLTFTPALAHAGVRRIVPATDRKVVQP